MIVMKIILANTKKPRVRGKELSAFGLWDRYLVVVEIIVLRRYCFIGDVEFIGDFHGFVSYAVNFLRYIFWHTFCDGAER